MHDSQIRGPEYAPHRTESDTFPVQYRIPRAIEQHQFCPKHGRSYPPRQDCPECEQECTAPLPGVADEQPAPHGKGVDVAALVHADLERGVFLPPYPTPREIYVALLTLAVALRVRMVDKAGDTRPAVTLVCADLEARIESGRKKYGERLTTHNGRDAQMDLYQEILDAVAYARQDMYEREHEAFRR